MESGPLCEKSFSFVGYIEQEGSVSNMKRFI